MKLPRKKTNIKLIVLIVLISVICSGIGGFFIGRLSQPDNSVLPKTKFKNNKYPEEFNFSIMDEILKIIDRDYVDKEKIDNQKMFHAMMAGLVAGLEDPYTVFMTPKRTKEFNEDIDGKFQGIGAEIAQKGGFIVIVAPLADSPAERAGLKAGDKIFAIDDEDATGLTVSEAVQRIRGEKGTVVKLSIVREDTDPFDVEVTRDVIYIKSVKTEIKEGNIAYIEISNFNTDTNSLFNKAVDEMKAKNIKGIVLDMRNNPGGLLDSAIFVASAWVENSNVVVSEKFGDGTVIDYNAKGTSDFINIPTVVLIDRGSASGSEIVAGALKDYEKATLVGEQTFGKGSVQNLQTLSDGSSLKITIAKWLTPNGVSISEEGVSPDEEVEYTREDFENDLDPQLDRALEILKEE